MLQIHISNPTLVLSWIIIAILFLINIFLFVANIDKASDNKAWEEYINSHEKELMNKEAKLSGKEVELAMREQKIDKREKLLFPKKVENSSYKDDLKPQNSPSDKTTMPKRKNSF